MKTTICAAQMIALLLALSTESARGTTLSGHVADTNAAPLAGIPVEILRISPTSGKLVKLSSASTNTDALGNFTTIQLPQSNYWLRVNNTTNVGGDPTPTGFEGLYYHHLGNSPSRDPLSPIVVGSGSNDMPGFDFVLRSAIAVTGSVFAVGLTNFALVDFDAFDASTGDFLPLINAKATSNGTYQLYGFPPGSFFVQCDPDPQLGYYPVYQGDVFLDSDAFPLTPTGANIPLDFSLSPGFSVSGTVTNSSGGVSDVDIDTYQVTGNGPHFIPDTARTGTNPPGGFSTSLLPPDDYLVRADPSSLDPFAVSYFNTNGIVAQISEDATPVTVANSNVTNVNISLTDGGRISGTATVSGGGPAANIDIDVYDTAFRRMEVNTSTDSNGIYAIGPLLSGDYVVRADPTHAQMLVRQYYTNALFIEDGAAVSVAAATVTSNIDFSLDQGGLVSGRITDTQDVAVADVDLDIFNTSNALMEVGAVSDTNGAYTLGVLPPGDYFVRADPAVTQQWVVQYYTNSLFVEQATPVVTTPGAVSSNINFALQSGGHLAGALTDTNGLPAADVDIDVFDIGGQRMEANASSDTNGVYYIGALPPASYTLRADPSATQFLARTYYPTGGFSENAQTVLVTDLQTNTGLDMVLSGAGIISGTVFDASNQPLTGIDIDVFDALSGVRMEGTTLTASNGTYAMGPIPQGQYAVRADPIAGQPYVREYFFEAAYQAQATTVAVSPGAVVTNVNMTLAPGATISGGVYDLQTNHLVGIDLDIFPASGGSNALEQTSLSGSNGVYIIGPVPVGNWALRAHSSAQQGYETRYYLSTGNISNATPISVLGGQDLTNINFFLGTNYVPIADIAPFSGVTNGTNFTLDAGVSTDANDDRLLYEWRQLAGPAITISDTNAAAPVFTIPYGTPTGTVFEFEVTTYDFSVTSTPKRVKFANGAPLIWQFARQATNTGLLSWTLGASPQPYTLESSSNFLYWTNIYAGDSLDYNVNVGGKVQFYRIKVVP